MQLTPAQQQVAGELLREVRNRLQFLVDVGLDYLTLGRPAPTLSGGESQRIRLASQIGSGLTGVLYVLDEPTIGLHPRDNRRLLGALQQLRDLGNTLILVEHDREVIAAADYLLDFGPGAGDRGGEITARGTPKQVMRAKASLTGQYLSGKKSIPVPTNRRMHDRSERGERSEQQSVRYSAAPPRSPRLNRLLIVKGARQHNLQQHRRGLPAGRVRRRDRRERLRQEFAGQRGAVPDAGPHGCTAPARRPPPTTTSSAWSRSTRSSTSIRTASATRRRRTRRPTPASST